MPMERWVPTIDLSAGGAPAAIDAACRRAGFFSVTGHGVPPAVIGDAWAAARRFFDRPLAERMAVAMPYPGYPYGYSPIAGERLSASMETRRDETDPTSTVLADLKESFAIGPVERPRHVIVDPDESFAWSENLWPGSVPELRAAWEVYFRAMSDLAGRLLSMMAEALGLPRTWFDSMIDRHTSAMRALNYPGREDLAPAAGQLGASAHSDYGTITILLADPDEPGLEVLDLDGVWQPVDPPAGSLVVNLGDAMARWTNDRWRSTLHRVRIPAGRRQSIAFFHNANWDAVIECLPTCLAAGEHPKYPPMAAGPHLMSKFTATVNTAPPS